MILIKIGKDIKLKKYDINGMRLFIKDKKTNKWKCYTINSHKTNLIFQALKLLISND